MIPVNVVVIVAISILLVIVLSVISVERMGGRVPLIVIIFSSLADVFIVIFKGIFSLFNYVSLETVKTLLKILAISSLFGTVVFIIFVFMVGLANAPPSGLDFFTNPMNSLLTIYSTGFDIALVKFPEFLSNLINPLVDFLRGVIPWP